MVWKVVWKVRRAGAPLRMGAPIFLFEVVFNSENQQLYNCTAEQIYKCKRRNPKIKMIMMMMIIIIISLVHFFAFNSGGLQPPSGVILQ